MGGRNPADHPKASRDTSQNSTQGVGLKNARHQQGSSSRAAYRPKGEQNHRNHRDGSLRCIFRQIFQVKIIRGIKPNVTHAASIILIRPYGTQGGFKTGFCLSQLLHQPALGMLEPIQISLGLVHLRQCILGRTRIDSNPNPASQSLHPVVQPYALLALRLYALPDLAQPRRHVIRLGQLGKHILRLFLKLGLLRLKLRKPAILLPKKIHIAGKSGNLVSRRCNLLSDSWQGGFAFCTAGGVCTYAPIKLLNCSSGALLGSRLCREQPRRHIRPTVKPQKLRAAQVKHGVKGRPVHILGQSGEPRVPNLQTVGVF